MPGKEVTMDHDGGWSKAGPVDLPPELKEPPAGLDVKDPGELWFTRPKDSWKPKKTSTK